MTVWPLSCTCRGNYGSKTVQGRAEQGCAADCFQRPLRSRFRQRLKPSVRLNTNLAPKLEELEEGQYAITTL
jgi:hypothetical protein